MTDERYKIRCFPTHLSNWVCDFERHLTAAEVHEAARDNNADWKDGYIVREGVRLAAVTKEERD